MSAALMTLGPLVLLVLELSPHQRLDVRLPIALFAVGCTLIGAAIKIRHRPKRLPGSPRVPGATTTRFRAWLDASRTHSLYVGVLLTGVAVASFALAASTGPIKMWLVGCACLGGAVVFLRLARQSRYAPPGRTTAKSDTQAVSKPARGEVGK